MARPKVRIEPPWFDRSRYAAADKMDAADWYVNLELRAYIARTDDDRCARNLVRGAHPIIRRSDPRRLVLDARTAGILSDVLLGEPPTGIEYLRAHELYYFERRLPEAIRNFGAKYVHGQTPTRDAPAGFLGPLDHLLAPRQLSAFVRLDLSLPDDVLVQDLRDFLAPERRALAALGGEQPYREALRMLGKVNRANLYTFAALGVLAYLDLSQWGRDSGVPITDAQYAELLNIDRDRLRETKAKAALVRNVFFLRGWLLRAAREAIRKSAPQGFAGSLVRKFS